MYSDKKDERTQRLKIIKIFDPALCVRCNLAYVAEVKMKNGTIRKMLYCARKDCDNWTTT